MTCGSLFSGIGGIDLGLQRAGFEIRFQVEIDPWCRRVLAKHWPNVTRYEDVRDVGAENLEAVDLIAGGFPCQPFSLAGKRRGESDDRNLWPEMRRIVDELRPRWVFAENVPGIISLYLDTVLSDLEALGYTTGAVVLPACGFEAPHIRQRLFIVANADRERQSQSDRRFKPVGQWPSDSRETWHEPSLGGWWGVEPDVGRVAYGIPAGVDRLRGLGNTVVPQVIEFIGRQIRAVDSDR